MNNLSREEQELLDSVENGDWKSVENLEERKSTYKGYMKDNLGVSEVEKANIVASQAAYQEGDYLTLEEYEVSQR